MSMCLIDEPTYSPARCRGHNSLMHQSSSTVPHPFGLTSSPSSRTNSAGRSRYARPPHPRPTCSSRQSPDASHLL
ncbi:hypothetical protein B0F90DRAFT_1802995, partial [Multifurca ochricompacta]